MRMLFDWACADAARNAAAITSDAMRIMRLIISLLPNTRPKFGGNIVFVPYPDQNAPTLGLTTHRHDLLLGAGLALREPQPPLRQRGG